ncbi:MAG TPA: acyl carrier protein [Opitutaceae bacterium]|nr:acyl carrier protein [Opitutaceae bacterium]
MNSFTSEEEAGLRETLKRCSPATIEAACEYRRTGSRAHLPVLVHGIIERYVKRDLIERLQRRPDDLLLSAHLGIDSLTMLEIVLLAEDVLQISIHNEDLRPLRTLGDVQRFIEGRLRAPVVERSVPDALKTARA